MISADEDTDPDGRLPVGPNFGDIATQIEHAGDDVDTAAGDAFQTRGLNPLGALRYVRRHHGSVGMVKVVSALSARDRLALGGDDLAGLTSSTWVPFLTHARLLATIDRSLGVGDLSLLPAVGRFKAQADLPGLLKPVLRLMTPGFLISQSMRLWRRYHSHGRWEIVRTSSDIRAVLVDHELAHPAFCATFCGYVEGALLFSGARLPKVTQTACRCHGDRVCAFLGVFDEQAGNARSRVPQPPN